MIGDEKAARQKKVKTEDRSFSREKQNVYLYINVYSKDRRH